MVREDMISFVLRFDPLRRALVRDAPGCGDDHEKIPFDVEVETCFESGLPVTVCEIAQRSGNGRQMRPVSLSRQLNRFGQARFNVLIVAEMSIARI